MRREWLRMLVLTLVMICAAVPFDTARADGPDLRGVAFDQKLDAQLPLDAIFRDERDQPVRLRDYFKDKPVVLTLNYLRCQNLCPLELETIAGTLAKMPFELGNQYDALTISIDARDTPVVAAGKRQFVLGLYDKPGSEAGWHFLTGDQESIDAVARAVGFDFRYDAQTDDYMHPLGVVVITPGGRVSRYLYGLDFPVRDLRLALVEASASRIATPVDRVLLFCYHYEPSAGRYTAAAMNFVRLGGLTGMLVLGGLLLIMWRAERRGEPHA